MGVERRQSSIYPEDIAAVIKMDEYQHNVQRMGAEKRQKKSKHHHGAIGPGTRKSSRDITETVF